MPTYITNVNHVNGIATVHCDSCVYIDSELVTSSSQRRPFTDGLQAIKWAANEMPNCFTFCGHCMKDANEVMRLKAVAGRGF